MPINRMLKDKRAPEEIELLNQADLPPKKWTGLSGF